MYLFLAVVVVPGCGVSRKTGASGRSIGDYDYCVVTEKHAYRYTDDAIRILNKSFVVVKDDDDPRLVSPAVRQKACLLSLDWNRGF